MTAEATMAGVTRPDRDTDFAQYVAARQSGLLRTAYLLTGDQHSAEDLVQTALAKLYLTWNRLAHVENLDAYLRRIMVNEHTSWWRRAWRRSETSVDEVPEQRSRPRDQMRDVGERDAMWSVVQTLPPRQRAAVVLRYYEDLSEQQTAEILGCSVGTVKSQTSRALATMRTHLQRERGEIR